MSLEVYGLFIQHNLTKVPQHSALGVCGCRPKHPFVMSSLMYEIRICIESFQFKNMFDQLSFGMVIFGR